MSKIYLFHGLSNKNIVGEPISPLFLASSRAVAESFSTSGKVAVVGVDTSEFMDFSDDDKPLIDYLKKVDVNIQELPFFYCEAITHHSNYDGTNVLDLAYLPEVQAMVASKGFKGIRMTDMHYNLQFDTYVLFDTTGVKVHENIPEDDKLENFA